MSVTLSPPSQLGFPRPLTAVVKRSLFITNPHSSPVAFKVKTTAPKQYCVRPNQGRVEPGQNIEVQIVLQPLAADPPPHAKCKDKFLVQSAFIPPDEEMRSLPEMWTNVERTNKAAIHEQKIRCAYLAAEDGSGDPNGIPEENEDSGTPLDHSRMDDSKNQGYTQWTTAEEREFDPTLFPNGGHTVWELPKPKVVPPKPIILAPVPPKPEPKPLPKITLAPAQTSLSALPQDSIVLTVDDNSIIVISSPHVGDPVPPQAMCGTAPQHDSLTTIQTIRVVSSSANPQAVFAAAQQSPLPKSANGTGSKDLPAPPASYGLAGAAAAAAAAGGAGVAAAANSASSHPVDVTEPADAAAAVPAAAPAAPAAAPVANPIDGPAHSHAASREIPSLSAADVAAAGAPTNAALEKSLDATTSSDDKLAVALAEIERLKAQLAEAQGPTVTGLRKRGGAGGAADVSSSAGSSVAATTKPAAAQGVPLEVCAGLVFAVFVLTYLFF